MSELVLPDYLKLKPTVEVIEQITKPPEKDEDKPTLLPNPSGYRLLCSVPQVSKKIDGTELDLERPDFYAKQEEHATTVLFAHYLSLQNVLNCCFLPTNAVQVYQVLGVHEALLL